MADIDIYLSGVKPEFRAELEKIRKLVHEIVPEAEESIGYGMPAFKYKKRPLLYFAAFKEHMSIFPTPKPLEEFQDRLKGYVVSKGTVQFTLEHPLPDQLIRDMIESQRKSIDNQT